MNKKQAESKQTNSNNSPFAKLPKQPQNPIDRPNNGHQSLIITLTLVLLALVILVGAFVYGASLFS